MSTIKIHNAETGQIVERDMTADELAQWEADKAEAQKIQEAKTQALSKKAIAEDKLAALGLNTDDLKALGLQHNY